MTLLIFLLSLGISVHGSIKAKRQHRKTPSSEIKFERHQNSCNLPFSEIRPFLTPSEARSPSEALNKIALLATNSITNTSYTHRLSILSLTYVLDSFIDGERGIYHTDCSCFLAYAIIQISMPHLKQVETGGYTWPPHPLAIHFHNHFGTGTTDLWRRIFRIDPIEAGDVITWRANGVKKGTMII
jgi:hypothetical protein